MVERARRFPHIPLKLTTEGTASSPSGGGRKQNPITTANFGNRQGHGSKLKSSVDSLIFYWQDSQEKREEEGKPALPDTAIPIILQIDPTAFDAEDLRKYGIEVIAELEDGSQKDKPSAFSCSGLGIWETIKPEVVEYGGDLVKNEGMPPSIITRNEVCPKLVRSTLNGGPAIAADIVGTSFSAPKVSHIAACIAAELPDESCLLYRALIVQSARWPAWTMAYEGNKLDIVRQMGYGLPNLERGLGNSSSRVTLITRGERRIKARQAHVYQVKLPEELRSQGDELEILLEITLSYKAQPRRTRRNRRKYLSTWLDWDCSKRGESPEAFLDRVLKDYNAPDDADRGEEIFKWTLGKQNNYGIIKDVSRSAGTLQKDWTVVKSFELTEVFCIAVVGHEGWNNDPDAAVPYSLVVSFEAVDVNIPIYAAVVEAQTQIEVEERVKI